MAGKEPQSQDDNWHQLYKVCENMYALGGPSAPDGQDNTWTLLQKIVANTYWLANNGGGGGGGAVSSVFGRAGAVVAVAGDYAKGDVGLGNVDNTSDANKPVSTAQQTALNLKADLASPTFTGTPTLPTGSIGVTQAAADSSTKLATTAFVTTADNLKANLASPTLTGTPAAPTAAVGTNTTQLATTAFALVQDRFRGITSQDSDYVILSTDDVVLINATANRAPVLPTPVGISGRVYTIKRTNTTGFTVTLGTAAGLIDGASTRALAANESIDVISDNSNWYIH